MLILHTADWHLGARLVDHERSAEHQCFLDWLLDTIQSRGVNLLIVAGDIFDSANPPQAALAQYYRFLAALSGTGCEVLIIGGNHDSAATLNAPRDLLRSLRVHVHGSAPADSTDALLEFPDAIVCAIPFLRERDVRIAEAGQTHDEVVASLRAGIKAHYTKVLAAAQNAAAGRPIIGTGHLTAVGVTSASSERDIHIGNLGAVGADCFDGYDYVALGHIHRPQCVARRESVRYSGSPIFLAFDEVSNLKQVLLLTVSKGQPVTHETLPLPIWRTLASAECDVNSLVSTLHQVKTGAADTTLTPWVELTITDAVTPADLDPMVRAAAAAAGVQVLKLIRQQPNTPFVLSPLAGRELHETTPEDIFAEKLRREGVEPGSEDYAALMGTFHELLSHMQEATTA
jgi:exonuclease SbcD